MGISRRTILKGAERPASGGRQFRVLGLCADRRPPPRRGAKFRRSCSRMAMATMRRCGSPRLWRMESNGVPRDRMLAINFTDPLARTDDAVAQPNRSSTEDQRRELGEAIKELKRRTGASRVALVGNSRGGNSIRSYIKNGGGADVSHAVLCGVPNHGVFDWDDKPGSEFNGRAPFLRGLNEGESEVTPGTAFLTLRSDGIDKFAQADGRFVGKPGTPTGITVGWPGAEGRHQSRARRHRPSRDRVSSARVPRDL